MVGPNTEATARLMTRPILPAELKIDRACQRWKMRERGGGRTLENKAIRVRWCGAKGRRVVLSKGHEKLKG